MTSFLMRLTALTLTLGGGAAASADTLIAAGLSAPDYAADFNTTGSGSGSGVPSGGRWEAVFGKPAADGESGAVHTAIWEDDAAPGQGFGQVQVQGAATAGGGFSRFVMREGTWIAARDAEGGLTVGTTAGEGAAAPGTLRTICTPADSCGDSACEEINLSWSLVETEDAGGTTRTALIYGDWYYREGEEATVLARLDPAVGCADSVLLDQPLAQHRDVCGADGGDSFWLVALDTPPGGAPALRWTRLPKGLGGAALSSGTLGASSGPDAADGSGEDLGPRHAVDADGAAVRALWRDAQGMNLADLATGEMTLIAPASQAARRPDLAVRTATTSGTEAAAISVTGVWETDAGVDVWRDGSLQTGAGASAPRLEKDAAGRMVLFYTKPETAGVWSLYARPLD